LATQISTLLQGKYKPTWVPNMDCGDYVVVKNAQYVDFSGKGWENKTYKWYTGWVGGLKQTTAKDMLVKKPTEILKHAVKGMLPKSNLARDQLAKLLIYPDENHPYDEAQIGGNHPIFDTVKIRPSLSAPLGFTEQFDVRVAKENGQWAIETKQFKFGRKDFKIMRKAKMYGLKSKAARANGDHPYKDFGWSMVTPPRTTNNPLLKEKKIYRINK
jgi:large subunit ribosomal protein L13